MDRNPAEQQERFVKNEALFREVNERIRQLTEQWSVSNGEGAEFTCECASAGCTEHVAVSLDEYERVRAHPNRFLVVPGHLDVTLETVVAERHAFWVVEKNGPAGEQAADLDPRS